MAEEILKTEPHRWKFFRAGGFDQALLENEDDLVSLGELDKRLWSALSCPVKGVEFDQRTLELIDTDNDGHIRVPEMLCAIDWAKSCLKDRSVLANGAAGVPLAALDEGTEQGKLVLDAARTVLANLGKPDAAAITVEDAADNELMIAQTRFNGDGVITPASTNDETLQGWIADLIACLGSVPDRSGEAGIGRETVERFSAQSAAWLAWKKEPPSGIANLLPVEGREEAIGLWHFIKFKLDDFFLRCSLASYDLRAATMMNSSEATLAALALRNLAEAGDDMALLPLSAVSEEAVLDLERGLNPAWQASVASLRSSVILPLMGELSTLSLAQWNSLKGSVEAYEQWWSNKPVTEAAGLGDERLEQWTAEGAEAALLDLVERDLALQPEFDAIVQVERLTRYCRDLLPLANNFVSFRDFYSGRGKAIFQCGTLYLDARSFELCVAVTDVAKHVMLANLSRVYLAYCDCVRNGGADKITIAAAITDGDCDQLLVGRNGVFFDRQGRDWHATVVRLIEHPISIRQAFWAPYKRIGKMVGEQLQKMANARSKATEEKIAGELMAGAPKKAEAKPAQQAFDVGKFAGIFAAIGLAVGALGTALASLIAGFVKLAWWQMPLALVAGTLIVSGPAVVIAAWKLHQRNLGRLLDANGWAVNTRARINIPFGASLTGLARLPQGAVRKLADPFEEKKRGKSWLILLLILTAAAFVSWKLGWLARR